MTIRPGCRENRRKETGLLSSPSAPLALATRYLKYLPLVSLERMTPYPLVLFIEVTRRCDLGCLHCDAWKLPREAGSPDLTVAALDRLAAEASDSGALVVHLGGGEPLLRTDIYEIVAAFARRGLRVGLTTSGAHLTRPVVDRLVEAGLSRLILSIDHPVPETHDQLRGRPGLFRHVVSTAPYLTARQLSWEINTVVHRRNYRRLIGLARLGTDLGASGHNLIPIMLNPPMKADQRSNDECVPLLFRLADLPELLARFDQYLEWIARRGPATTTCRRTLMAAVEHYAGTHSRYLCAVGGLGCDIFPDGTVVYCYGSGLALGNVRERTLAEIWRSLRAQSVKESLTGCTRCVDGCQADLRARFDPRFVVPNLVSIWREVGRILS